ncbi:WD40 repeat-like protein [Dendrothele bispora CBS 962.96]|uniref:WD40 repeat-like protein n=1 Tax=Dendrothele bispora (strain CBS 962.96) TaxID=1314807 RepID=A0A4S8KXU2_DENBC|nr:WD40 repeat-like protein [Dendrothele bispora CBS 962.96]
MNKMKLQNVMKVEHRMMRRGAIHTWNTTSAIESINLSCDGQKLVSGDNDGNIKLWDLVSGKEVDISIEGHDGQVNSVAFSADGTRVVSGSDDKTIRLWDTATGAQIGNPLHGHDHWIRSVAFSADGTRIVSGSSDSTIRLWDTTTEAQIGHPFQGHEDYVNSVAFSVDGTRIVSGSRDKTIRLWNTATGAQIGDPLQGHEHYVNGSILGTRWKLSEDGWIHFPGQFQGVCWIPQHYRVLLWRSQNTCLISKSGYNKISFSRCVYGANWTKCVAT